MRARTARLRLRAQYGAAARAAVSLLAARGLTPYARRHPIHCRRTPVRAPALRPWLRVCVFGAGAASSACCTPRTNNWTSPTATPPTRSTSAHSNHRRCPTCLPRPRPTDQGEARAGTPTTTPTLSRGNRRGFRLSKNRPNRTLRPASKASRTLELGNRHPERLSSRSSPDSRAQSGTLRRTLRRGAFYVAWESGA